MISRWYALLFDVCSHLHLIRLASNTRFGGDTVFTSDSFNISQLRNNDKLKCLTCTNRCEQLLPSVAKKAVLVYQQASRRHFDYLRHYKHAIKNSGAHRTANAANSHTLLTDDVQEDGHFNSTTTTSSIATAQLTSSL
jgi:hypothetical protein